MNYPTIKSYLLTILSVFCVASISIGSVLSPALSQEVETGSVDSLITVIIILDTDAQSTDLQLQAPSNSSYNRSDNIKRVIKIALSLMFILI